MTGGDRGLLPASLLHWEYLGALRAMGQPLQGSHPLSRCPWRARFLKEVHFRCMTGPLSLGGCQVWALTPLLQQELRGEPVALS